MMETNISIFLSIMLRKYVDIALIRQLKLQDDITLTETPENR